MALQTSQLNNNMHYETTGLHNSPHEEIVEHKNLARVSRLEDAFWVTRAEEALRSGFLSPQESMAFLLKRYKSS